MKNSIVLVGILSACVGAQTLTTSQNPVPAGSTLAIALTNTTTSTLTYSTGETILLHTDGERTLPRFAQTTDALSLLPPNASVPAQSMSIPSTGPGSVGSYVLYNRIGNGACLRQDIGAATVGFPALHAYPRRIYYPTPTDVLTTPGLNDEWMFLNTSGAAHVFGPGADIQLIAVGSGIVLSTVPLTGLVVPSQGQLVVALPTATLPAAPMTVRSSWIDPIAGALVRRHGVNTLAEGGATVHFRGGRTIPLAGTYEAWCAFRNLMPVPFAPAIPHNYALMVGTVDGTTNLPGGAIAPLSISDPFVLASLTNGAFGTLLNNVGRGVAAPFQGNLPVVTYFRADNIILQHPGPSLSGLVIRVACVATAPSIGAWNASQVTELMLQ